MTTLYVCFRISKQNGFGYLFRVNYGSYKEKQRHILAEFQLPAFTDIIRLT